MANREKRFWAATSLIVAAVSAAAAVAALGGDLPTSERPHMLSATIETPDGFANSVLPTPVADLPSPPAYTPDPQGSAESHCDVWQRWLEQQRASNLGFPWLQVSAPAEAPATVTAVRVKVYRAYRPRGVSSVMCDRGAGGLADTSLRLRLDHPRRPPILFTREGSRRVGPMPGAVFKVPAGGSEYLWLFANRRSGVFYEWGVTVDVTVDQRMRTEIHGTRAKPFRTWTGKMPEPVDFDMASQRWLPISGLPSP